MYLRAPDELLEDKNEVLKREVCHATNTHIALFERDVARGGGTKVMRVRSSSYASHEQV